MPRTSAAFDLFPPLGRTEELASTKLVPLCLWPQTELKSGCVDHNLGSLSHAITRHGTVQQFFVAFCKKSLRALAAG